MVSLCVCNSVPEQGMKQDLGLISFIDEYLNSFPIVQPQPWNKTSKSFQEEQVYLTVIPPLNNAIANCSTKVVC